MELIRLKDIKKDFNSNGVLTQALKGIDFVLNSGESVAIMGVSGSGKSTLLNIISMLDNPTSGEYIFMDNDVKNYSDSKKASLRAEQIGIVFQSVDLIENESVKQNVMLGLYIGTKYKIKDFNNIVNKALKAVGVEHLINKKVKHLSGGEKQRVAIARALVNDPAIILADEPTSALDSATANEIMDLLKQLQTQGKTIMVITHDLNVAKKLDRIAYIKDGKITP